ncbi:MAG: SAM-dependent chlorinase/fluorinase [Thermoplasmata archaeon]
MAGRAGAGASVPRRATISADIGPAYAAQMVGVLARLAPAAPVHVVDDRLPRHDVRTAAFLIRSILPWFPPGSVHLVIVDPGVGTSRRPLAVECRGPAYLVGPDNGVLWPAAERLGFLGAVAIDPARVVRDRVGTTFDGRDLFAPAAAWLLRGRPLRSLGLPVRPSVLRLAEPETSAGGIRGEVVYVDPFGNAITNLPSDRVFTGGSGGQLRVRWDSGPERRLRMVRAYGELAPGETGLLASSFGTIEIAIDQGSAAERWGIGPGTTVAIAGATGGLSRTGSEGTPRGRGRPARPTRGR